MILALDADRAYEVSVLIKAVEATAHTCVLVSQHQLRSLGCDVLGLISHTDMHTDALYTHMDTRTQIPQAGHIQSNYNYCVCDDCSQRTVKSLNRF